MTNAVVFLVRTFSESQVQKQLVLTHILSHWQQLIFSIEKSFALMNNDWQKSTEKHVHHKLYITDTGSIFF